MERNIIRIAESVRGHWILQHRPDCSLSASTMDSLVRSARKDADDLWIQAIEISLASLRCDDNCHMKSTTLDLLEAVRDDILRSDKPVAQQEVEHDIQNVF